MTECGGLDTSLEPCVDKSLPCWIVFEQDTESLPGSGSSSQSGNHQCHDAFSWLNSRLSNNAAEISHLVSLTCRQQLRLLVWHYSCFLFPHFAVLSEGVFRFSGVSPEPEVSILVRVALSSFTIGAVHTVGRSADPTHLTQRQVICPALMLSGQQNKGIRRMCTTTAFSICYRISSDVCR